MNFSRFTVPTREEADPERLEEIEAEKADTWRDQAQDRERELNHGWMPMICNWYHAPIVMRFEKCAPEMHGQPSHGMCPDCAKRFTEENNL